jgi:superfamily II DNA or RNA helicase
LKGIADGMVQKMRLYFWNDKVSIYKPWNDITDITICVWPTFNKYWRQFSWNFDMLIVDEAHMNFIHVWAAKKKWSEFTDRMQIYCQFECKHFFGFTATPESNDVNNDSFEYVFGKKYVAEWHQPTPTVLTHKYYTGIEMFRDWQHLQEILLDNDDRISNLCDRVKEVMQYRWMWVVFCDRIEMVNKVCDMLKTIWVESRAYTSKSQKRDELVASLRWKNGVIVSTYQTLKAWVDYPELDTAFYFMGVKFSATVKQLVWRILRVEKWKKIPIMIDFVDDVMPMYLQSRQRVKAYKERWWWEPLKYDASIVKDLSSKVL